MSIYIKYALLSFSWILIRPDQFYALCKFLLTFYETLTTKSDIELTDIELTDMGKVPSYSWEDC